MNPEPRTEKALLEGVSPEEVKILLVDDRPENLISLESLLKEEGEPVSYLFAGSGEEALKIALREELALILLDVQMPGMNGYEVARYLRNTSRTRDIPIIFVTAIDESTSHVEEGFAAGAVDFLFKPLHPFITKAKVAAFVGFYRQKKELEKANQFVHRINRELEERVKARTKELIKINNDLVNVTEMFRDPSFYLALRQHVLPILSTYPHVKIWDAGCSTGEELFSLAILLQEGGLLGRTKIYATDINQKVLKKAKEGIFPASAIASSTAAYQAAGGQKEFTSYYVSNYGSCKFDGALIQNVVFYPHNLATDSSFNEFHLILCRNVLIYFTRELQERVFRLFHESLVPLGYLGLGKKETLALSGLSSTYGVVDKENRIYRKTK